MSNDSSDSDDESQEPKGKRAGTFSGRSPLGKDYDYFLWFSLEVVMVVSA